MGAGRVRWLTGRCGSPASWRPRCGRCTSVRRRRWGRSWWTASDSPTWRTARWTRPSCAACRTWGLSGVEALVAPALDGGGPVYWSEVVARPGRGSRPARGLRGPAAGGERAGLALGLQRGAGHAGRARRGAGSVHRVVETGSHSASIAAVRGGDADVAAIDSHLFAALAPDDLVVVERLGPSPSQPLAAGPGAGCGGARADPGGAGRARRPASSACPGRPSTTPPTTRSARCARRPRRAAASSVRG